MDNYDNNQYIKLQCSKNGYFYIHGFNDLHKLLKKHLSYIIILSQIYTNI